jgi:hypothetical protein
VHPPLGEFGFVITKRGATCVAISVLRMAD